jgi:hypothetical protein
VQQQLLGTQQQQEVHNIPTSIYPTKKTTRIIFGSCEEHPALQAEGMKDYCRHHHYHLPTSTRYTSEDLNLN